MWEQGLILIALVGLFVFPRKFLFFIRVGYILYVYPLYTLFVRIWTIEDIQGQWTDHSVWFIGIKLRKLPDSVPVLKGKSVMLIGNHRNFCDFVLHDVITEHTANFLSRALVGLVFPFMALVSIATDGVWYFVRGGNKDFDKFFQWIDSKFQRHLTGRTHLLVYPEGHRNLKKEPLCLRSGMIRYAFSRQIPIQMFMCSGYDEVLNEKKISAAWGTSNVNYKVYEPIFTGQYLNFDSLIQELKDKFNTRFHEVHNPS